MIPSGHSEAGDAPSDDVPADSARSSIAIVACNVIEDALRGFAADADQELDLRFLDIRYHSDYDGMKRAIEETVGRAREDGADRVLIGYGSACHPEMEQIVDEADAELLPAVNCIHMLAGRETHAEVFRDDLLFVTPGWLAKLLPSVREDPDRFAVLDRIVFLNPTDAKRAANDDSGRSVESRLTELAELTGLPIERRESDREIFDALVEQALDR